MAVLGGLAVQFVLFAIAVEAGPFREAVMPFLTEHCITCHRDAM